MLLALGLIAAVSGVITFYLIKQKKPDNPYIHQNYSEKPFQYGGVRPHDFLGYNYQGNRVKFYPYNYVN